MESGNGEAPIIGQDDYGNSRSDPVFVKVLAVSIEIWYSQLHYYEVSKKMEALSIEQHEQHEISPTAGAKAGESY